LIVVVAVVQQPTRRSTAIVYMVFVLFTVNIVKIRQNYIIFTVKNNVETGQYNLIISIA